VLAGVSLGILGAVCTVCMRRLVDCAEALVDGRAQAFARSREAAPLAVPRSGRVPSYGDVGEAAAGPWGRALVDSALASSQLGFCATYFVFVAVNMQEAVETLGSCRISVARTTIFALLLLAWVPLSWVRRLKYFALVSIAADAQRTIEKLDVWVSSTCSRIPRNSE
ncbi:unnamed protein product, partial [Prorocentrum cordatum]